MEDAHSFIYIAVMNYLPTMEFSHPKRCRCRHAFQFRVHGLTGLVGRQHLPLWQYTCRQQCFSSNSLSGSLCRYWADIDTQLRRVAYEKRIKVRLLISCWGSSQPLMFPFLKSLATVHDPRSKLDIQVVSSSPGHWLVDADDDILTGSLLVLLLSSC